MKQFVYRAKRLKQGKRVVAATFTGRYRLAGDTRDTHVSLAVSDKQVAQEKLRRIVLEAEREREGLILPRRQRDAIAASFGEHVKAYCLSRRAIGCDEKYVRELERKLFKLEDDCQWSNARQVTSESFEKWRANQAKAPKTLNEYLNAACALMNWLEPRIGSNPLRFIQRVQTGGKSNRERRSFTIQELERLVGQSGARGALYLFAARTGLRRGELSKLEWRDVHLDGPQPFVNVRASISKNRRQAQLPLSADASAPLRQLRCAPSTFVFKHMMPRMPQFRADLAVAGIPYVNERGEYADFHALRKTFGTLLTLAGVSPRTVMELMRHSDMRLTAKTYTDANLLPISEAIGKLAQISVRLLDAPIHSPAIVVASPSGSTTVGLDLAKSDLLSALDQTFSPSESASVRESLATADGARCRVRTCDFLRVKQALYH